VGLGPGDQLLGSVSACVLLCEMLVVVTEEAFPDYCRFGTILHAGS
jgi:hypothetical protein